MRIRAYLMTVYEDRTNRPVYGKAVMTDVATAWRNPSLLRTMLPARLQRRFDEWVVELGAEQLNLFDQEDA